MPNAVDRIAACLCAFEFPHDDAERVAIHRARWEHSDRTDVADAEGTDVMRAGRNRLELEMPKAVGGRLGEGRGTEHRVAEQPDRRVAHWSPGRVDDGSPERLRVGEQRDEH